MALSDPERIEHGTGRAGELETLLDICSHMKGGRDLPPFRCLRHAGGKLHSKFYDEFAAHIRQQRCPVA